MSSRRRGEGSGPALPEGSFLACDPPGGRVKLHDPDAGWESENFKTTTSERESGMALLKILRLAITTGEDVGNQVLKLVGVEPIDRAHWHLRNR